MYQGRNFKLDHFKLFLIFSVVLGHICSAYVRHSYILECLWLWVYLFHIPGFVFVSGLFSKSIVQGNKWDKILPYLLLFIVMGILDSLIIWIKDHTLIINFFSGNSVRWYAISMFFWYSITIVLKKACALWVMLISLFLSLIVGYFPWDSHFLAWMRTIIFYPFFYAGYLLDSNKITKLLGSTKLRIASVAIIVLSLALVYFEFDNLEKWRDLFRGCVAYSNIDEVTNALFGPLWRIAAFLTSGVLALSILTCVPGKEFPFVSALSRKTLPVYTFHTFVFNLFLILINSLNNWILVEPLWHCLWISLVLLCICSSPIFDWPVRKLMRLFIKHE